MREVCTPAAHCSGSAVLPLMALVRTHFSSLALSLPVGSWGPCS